MNRLTILLIYFRKFTCLVEKATENPVFQFTSLNYSHDVTQSNETVLDQKKPNCLKQYLEGRKF